MSGEFGWETMLASDAPDGCSLRTALFTTYDRPDERFVAENLLPNLLQLSREPDGEGAEGKFFLLELDNALQRLHDRITIVSSSSHEEPTEVDERAGGPYRWIWRAVRHLVVGCDRQAVQHAKLWLLHWRAENGEEHLEIVVSSANLTRSAFRDQIQAGWRTCIHLRPRPSKANLKAWGVLPAFLRALARSTGFVDRFDEFISLLARAQAPNADFIASVPGEYSPRALRRTPWGLFGLAAAAPRGRGEVKASVLAPYLGAWSRTELADWCTAFGGAPHAMELLWITKDHPWAGNWIMPPATHSALKGAGTTFRRLCHGQEAEADFVPFHDHHLSADRRWSHAKLYRFRRGMRRSLLVTSANLSKAAWGKWDKRGRLCIENFELGVVLQGKNWQFGSLDRLLTGAATTSAPPRRQTTAIPWADASWNGSRITVRCRCRPGSLLRGRLRIGPDATEIRVWRASRGDAWLRHAEIRWTKPWRAPFLVELQCEGDVLSIPVFDARVRKLRIQESPLQVDKAETEILQDLLLIERWGGRRADDPDEPPSPPPVVGTVEGGDSGDLRAPPDGAPGLSRRDSYAVAAFVRAREHFVVVDKWSAAAERVLAESGHERDHILAEGEGLVAAFRRLASREQHSRLSGTAEQLAADEIAFRLKAYRGA